MNKQQTRLFFAGFGYTARKLAEILPAPAKLYATARSEEQAERLRGEGVEPVLLGRDTPPEHAAWLISAPPDEEGCPIQRAFAAHAKSASWIGYLSTTGVYGDLGGRWAFEWSAPNPQSEKGGRRAQAEADWLSTHGPVHIFRLPGIYGPGRSALDRVTSDKARAIIKEGQVFSRVHVEDIARCLMASLERPNPGRVYHPCDDWPAPPQDVLFHAADLLGVARPRAVPFEEAELSKMAQRFYEECKRISNARTKSELGWYPKYPDYQTGLRAILDAEHT